MQFSQKSGSDITIV